MAGGHDQLFKDLITTFPHELLELMTPGLARRLDPESFGTRAGETFLDLPRGATRRPDVVLGAQAGGLSLLLHFEAELRFRSTLPGRLWSYNRLLHLRSGLPVYTFLLCLRGGPPGLCDAHFREAPLGREICRFRYRSLGLAGAPASRYLHRGRGLGAALAALMRWPRGMSPAERYLACTRRIVRARGLNDAQRFLLFNCVTTYLELDEGARRDVAVRLSTPTDREVRKLMMTWAEKERREGMKDLLLHQLEARFPSLPAVVRTRVGAMTSIEELTVLGKRLAIARSLAELGLA